MAPPYCWTLVTRAFQPKGVETESHNKLPAKLLKSTRALGWKGSESIRQPNACPQPGVPQPRLRPGCQGPRIIAPLGGLSTRGAGPLKGPKTELVCVAASLNPRGLAPGLYPRALSLCDRRGPTWKDVFPRQRPGSTVGP